ncbi:MAG: hypothetical protein PHH11_10330 [Methylomonas sp.]|nr:hypothetical protein [Methylomonas sp.]
MTVIIADAGPIIALAKVDQLALLPKLFPSITITQAVCLTTRRCLHHSLPHSNPDRIGRNAIFSNKINPTLP